MQNNLSELTALIAPPQNPKHSRGDWQVVEDDLGLELPSDYKLIIETYGYGEFCDHLTVINPFISRPYRKNALQIVQQWEGICELCADEYPLYPTEGGLLPCCVNINAHYVSWRTHGLPDEWEIIVLDSSEPTYHASGIKSLVEFLADLLARRSPLNSLLIPSLIRQPEQPPWFTQYEMNPITGQSVRI